MFEFPLGSKPALTVCAFAALALAGCSSAGSHQYTAENAAVAPQTVAQAAHVEVEDDGLPSQTPPSNRIRQIPDEPNEPYSRNYGGPNPGIKPATARGPEQEVPGKIPSPVPSQPYWKPATAREKVAAIIQDE